MVGLRIAIGRAALLSLVAAPLAGQSASGTTTVSAEMTMDRLAKELRSKVREQVTIQSLLATLTGRMNAEIDTAARRNALRRRLELTSRLKSLEVEGGQLREKLQALCASMSADGYLGLVLQGETSSLHLGTYEDSPTVVSIEPGSPAERAGVAPGDIVIEIGGTVMAKGTMSSVQRLLRPGARLSLRVKRGVETKMLTATVEPRPSGARQCPVVDETYAVVQGGVPGFVTMSITSGDSLAEPARVIINGSQAPTTRPGQPVNIASSGASPSVAYSFSTRSDQNQAVVAGATLSTMKGALLEAFGVERGVLVLSVLPGSPFATAGLREGDVILSVASDEPNSPYEVQRDLRRAEGEISVQVWRRKKRVTLALPCPRC